MVIEVRQSTVFVVDRWRFELDDEGWLTMDDGTMISPEAVRELVPALAQELQRRGWK